MNTLKRSQVVAIITVVGMVAALVVTVVRGLPGSTVTVAGIGTFAAMIVSVCASIKTDMGDTTPLPPMQSATLQAAPSEIERLLAALLATLVAAQTAPAQAPPPADLNRTTVIQAQPGAASDGATSPEGTEGD